MAAQRDLIGEFVSALREKPSNKAPDGFWPIGVFESRTASARAIDVLEARSPLSAKPFELPWAPSVLLNLYYFFALGTRVLHFSRSKAVDFGTRILSGVERGRTSGLLNHDGTNRLSIMEHAMHASLPIPSEVSTDVAVITRRLGALSFAYAEAVAFVGHRLITEIHGPYRGSDGSILVVRTVNLGLASMLGRPVLAPYDRLLILIPLVGWPGTVKVMFDIFGHPLFDGGGVNRGTPWIVGMRAEGMTALAEEEIQSCYIGMYRDLKDRLTDVDRMTVAERCAELGRIMLGAVLVSSGSGVDDILPALASFPREIAPGGRWAGEREKFLQALDVRTELTDAYLFPRYS